MPELPEVETICRSLRPVCGRRISSVFLSPLAPVEGTSPSRLKTALRDHVINEVYRRGKYLVLRLESETGLVIHLGMSGQLRFFANLPARPKHTHLELNLSGGSLLRFIDARRFGTLSLSFRPDGNDNPFLARLGPDYDDPAFTVKEFISRCRRHPGLSLKAVTLDQGIAAGLGNIYACESLYRAGLNPRRRVRKTDDRELASLLWAARESLELGIRHGGTTLRDYLDGLGQRGKMKEFLQVYARKGLTLDGRGKVTRFFQQGRSTWFCPEVQK